MAATPVPAEDVSRLVVYLLERKPNASELKDLDRVLNNVDLDELLKLCGDTTLVSALKATGDTHWEVASRLLSRMVVALGPGSNQTVLESGIVDWLGQTMVQLLRTAKGHQQVRGGRAGSAPWARSCAVICWARMLGPRRGFVWE